MSQKIGRIDPKAYANISGAMVRAVRLYRKLSVRDLAEKAGISKTTLLRIEADEPVRTISLIRLCKALTVMPEQLIQPVEGEQADASVRIIREQSTPFRICYLMSSAPKSLSELMAVEDVSERQRLANLGFVNGFLRLIPGLHPDPTFNAAIFEPQSFEGATYQTGPPGGPNRHPGREFAYCLQGPVSLIVGGRSYRMETGDAAFFDSGLDHNCALIEPPDEGKPPQLLTVWIEESGWVRDH